MEGYETLGRRQINDPLNPLDALENITEEDIRGRLDELEATFAQQKQDYADKRQRYLRLLKSLFGASSRRSKAATPKLPREGSVNRRVYDTLVEFGPQPFDKLQKRVKHDAKKLVHILRVGGGRYWTRDGDMYEAIAIEE